MFVHTYSSLLFENCLPYFLYHFLLELLLDMCQTVSFFTSHLVKFSLSQYPFLYHIVFQVNFFLIKASIHQTLFSCLTHSLSFVFQCLHLLQRLYLIIFSNIYGLFWQYLISYGRKLFYYFKHFKYTFNYCIVHIQ